jgi:LysR family transcriptional regulator, nod-box dependent transcriptional activator
MRLEKLDLNLLVALDVLLQERGVSLAADRLFLSQSATSGVLSRLRDYFKDDLLVLSGRSMVLTPRAEQLVEPVRAVLEQIRETILVAEPFDPKTSDRTLTIMATDYVVEILLRPAIIAFATEAPGVTFQLVPIIEQPAEALLRGRADLLIGIGSAVSPDHPTTLLYTEDFVIVGWKDNPTLAAPMTLETYQKLGHVAVRFGQNTASYEASAARTGAITRRVEVITSNFASVGGLIVNTQRIATLHRLLALRMAEYLPLKLMELPFQMPPVQEVAQWSTRSANDPAIAWLVERLGQIAKQLQSSNDA